MKLANQEDRVSTIEKALDFVTEQNIVFAKEVIKERAYDKQAFIRMAVFDMIQELGTNELKQASQMKDLNLISLTFSKVSEEELTLSALKIIQMLAKMLENKTAGSKDQLKSLEKGFHEHKDIILLHILPSQAS